MNPVIYPAAVLAVKALDKEMRTTLPDEIVNCIQLHSGLAVAASFIPVGGLDVAALTGNIWTMYARINKFLGISFNENIIKSIGSTLTASLTSNITLTGIATVFKWFPGIGTITGGIVMGATVYATTISAAWIYLTAIANWAKEGKGSSNNLESCIEDVIVQNKKQINDIIQNKEATYSA